jgi:hypothetical protein
MLWVLTKLASIGSGEEGVHGSDDKVGGEAVHRGLVRAHEGTRLLQRSCRWYAQMASSLGCSHILQGSNHTGPAAPRASASCSAWCSVSPALHAGVTRNDIWTLSILRSVYLVVTCAPNKDDFPIYHHPTMIGDRTSIISYIILNHARVVSPSTLLFVWQSL